MIQFAFVDESEVSTFVYWRSGIRQGMHHLSDLYEHVSTFSLSDRLQAYQLSTELMQAGTNTCLTLSENSYSVWKSLRAS